MIIGPYGAQHHYRAVTLLSKSADGEGKEFELDGSDQG